MTSDAGLLAYRELDDALGLTAIVGGVIADNPTGRNGWHGIVGLLRQSVYGRLAGYEDVTDADRLGRDPAMRWIVGGQAVERGGASTSQMGRFETELLATDDNLAALADLSGMWIERVHERNPPTCPSYKLRPAQKSGPFRVMPDSVCDPHTILLHGVLSDFRCCAVRQLEIIAPRH